MVSGTGPIASVLGFQAPCLQLQGRQSSQYSSPSFDSYVETSGATDNSAWKAECPQSQGLVWHCDFESLSVLAILFISFCDVSRFSVLLWLGSQGGQLL